MGEGIPENEWDISELEDDGKGGADYKKPDFSPSILPSFSFDKKKFQQMIQQAKIQLIEEENRIKKSLEEEKNREEINSMSWLELMKSKNI